MNFLFSEEIVFKQYLRKFRISLLYSYPFFLIFYHHMDVVKIVRHQKKSLSRFLLAVVFVKFFLLHIIEVVFEHLNVILLSFLRTVNITRTI